MGDHRASIKCEFEMHGHRAKKEWYINWCPLNGCDYRITDWFQDQLRTALRRYEEAMSLANQATAAAQVEKVERAELARLKAKYGE